MKKNQLSVFIIIGLVFWVIGWAQKSSSFWIIGFVFLAIGFSGKKK
ncbi:hypothetical protein IV487_09160 [Enterococcus saccharolyticus]|nr:MULTISPECIES: hypothetical protein [Enterococcus]MCD5002630.1 hypothetical protein [Enterococcus saccharolyticus]